MLDESKREEVDMTEPPHSKPDREGWVFPGAFVILWVIGIIAAFTIGIIVLL